MGLFGQLGAFYPEVNPDPASVEGFVSAKFDLDGMQLQRARQAYCPVTDCCRSLLLMQDKEATTHDSAVL